MCAVCGKQHLSGRFNRPTEWRQHYEMLCAAQDGCLACVKAYVEQGGSTLGDGRILGVWHGSCSEGNEWWNAWRASFEGRDTSSGQGQEAVRAYLRGLPDADRQIAETERAWTGAQWSRQWCRSTHRNPCFVEETLPKGVWLDTPETLDGGMPESGNIGMSESGNAGVRVGHLDSHKHGTGPWSLWSKDVSVGNGWQREKIEEFHWMCWRGDLDAVKKVSESSPWLLFRTSELCPGLRARGSDYAKLGQGRLCQETALYLQTEEQRLLMECSDKESGFHRGW